MYGTLATPFLIGLGGGIFVVWLVASWVAVNDRRLPALLRVVRFPAGRSNPPGSVQIAVFQVRSKEGLWAYRLFLGTILLLTQTAQLRSATDAHTAATRGPAPLLEACAEWLLMLVWSLYVLVEFHRAAARSR